MTTNPANSNINISIPNITAAVNTAGELRLAARVACAASHAAPSAAPRTISGGTVLIGGGPSMTVPVGDSLAMLLGGGAIVTTPEGGLFTGGSSVTMLGGGSSVTMLGGGKVTGGISNGDLTGGGSGGSTGGGFGG